jgi:hypothetical protein
VTSKRYLLIGTFFLILVAAALAIAALRELVPSFVNILMLLTGLFAMAALSAFHRLIDSSRSAPLIKITFNEDLANTQLEEASKAMPKDFVDAEFVPVSDDPWEVEAEDLLGRDNSLAVAKLRIDLERELRKIATRVGINKDSSRFGLTRLANELVKRKALDPTLLPVINDILPAANKVIHGGQVSHQTASAILRLGRQLIKLLRQQDRRTPTG